MFRAQLWRVTTAALLVLMGASACKADVQVALDVDRKGTGIVEVTATLDREATSRTPELASQLRIDDLKSAGWQVQGPTKFAERWVVRATKRFANPSEATSVLDELSGSDGPFSAMRIEVHRHPLWSNLSLRGGIDLKGGIERFGDADLRRYLDGSSFGIEAKEAQEILDLTLAVRFPGRVEAKGAEQVHGAQVWTGQYGRRVVVQASSLDLAPTREVAAGLAGVALVVFLLLLRALRARRHRPRLPSR